MRAVLAQRRPDDGILGEEFGDKAGTSGLTWVLDPIDGTRGFLSGTPTWGVLIAVGDANGPILGIIDQPYIGERFIGGLGLAQLDRTLRAARTLKPAPPARWTRRSFSQPFPRSARPTKARSSRHSSSKVKLTRYGMDCYAYALVAAGQIDLVVEAGLHIYDVQAPIAVIEAAGGIVTDWAGGPVHQGGQVLAAANVEIHTAALAILRTVAP